MNVLNTTATHIDNSQFQITCECSKGFHRFGNSKDPITYRTEYRGMTGHGCNLYTDCCIIIDESTKFVNKLPKIQKRMGIFPVPFGDDPRIAYGGQPWGSDSDSD